MGDGEPKGAILRLFLFLTWIKDIPQHLLVNSKLFAYDMCLSSVMHKIQIFANNIKRD